MLCLFVRCRFVRQELEGMLERRAEDAVAVAGSAGGAGEVDDEGGADRAGDAARGLCVRGGVEGVGPESLGDPGGLALEHVLRRLRRDVARGKPGAAGREDKPRFRGDLTNCGCYEWALVRHEAADHLVTVPAEQLFEDVPASVLGLAARDAVGDGQDGRFHTCSFVFSTRWTSPIDIALSIALHMS